MFKDKEIIDMISLKEENILKYIQEGLINDDDIINQYNVLNGILKKNKRSEKQNSNEENNENKEQRKDNSKRRKKENLIIETYCKSRMNPNNKNEEMIKEEFLNSIRKIELFKSRDFSDRYDNIEKEGEFYLKIIHLFELDINKRKKELKPELIGSLYYDKIIKKVKELENYSDFLTKKKKIEKEDKNKFITFLVSEFKEIEKTSFEEDEILKLADKYIKWKLNKEKELLSKQQNSHKTLNTDINNPNQYLE
jgi:hypothetical protein